VSSVDVDSLHRITVTSIEQQCWKFASSITNDGTSRFHQFFVKMWRLENIESYLRFYLKWNVAAFVITMDCEWAMGVGVVVMCRTPALLPLKLAVILLQLSHRAACSNTQHCIVLLTYCCTADSTVLVDMLAISSSSLLLLMIILASCRCRYQFLYRIRLLCAQDDEQWGRTERFAVPSPRFVTSVNWSWEQTDGYWPSQ
jgi:hypothetical protein